MKDKKMAKLERIKEYDEVMEVLYHALGKAIDNPGEKDRHLNIPYNICKYQETTKFIKGHPRWHYEEYDLPLLKKEIGDLSESDLVNWQIKIAQVRGSLQGIKDDIDDLQEEGK